MNTIKNNNLSIIEITDEEYFKKTHCLASLVDTVGVYPRSFYLLKDTELDISILINRVDVGLSDVICKKIKKLSLYVIVATFNIFLFDYKNHVCLEEIKLETPCVKLFIHNLKIFCICELEVICYDLKERTIKHRIPLEDHVWSVTKNDKEIQITLDNQESIVIELK